MDSTETAFLGTFFLFFIPIIVFYLIAMWKIFTKAGQKGWACLIPIYNTYILLKIVGKPGWWLLLFFIPLVNIVFLIWTYNLLSKAFGKDEGFTVGLILAGFIFIPILAFSSAKYIGAQSKEAILERSLSNIGS